MYSVFIIEIPYPSKIRDNTSIKNSPPINQIYTHIIHERNTHPIYLLGLCTGKCAGIGVSSAIFYSYPCCCHHRLKQEKRKKRIIIITELGLKILIYIYDIIFLSKS